MYCNLRFAFPKTETGYIYRRGEVNTNGEDKMTTIKSQYAPSKDVTNYIPRSLLNILTFIGFKRFFVGLESFEVTLRNV